MTNILNNVKNKVKSLMNKKGEGYIDTGIKIIIGVVVGSLIFMAIYNLFNNTILSSLSTEVGKMLAFTNLE